MKARQPVEHHSQTLLTQQVATTGIKHVNCRDNVPGMVPVDVNKSLKQYSTQNITVQISSTKCIALWGSGNVRGCGQTQEVQALYPQNGTCTIVELSIPDYGQGCP